MHDLAGLFGHPQDQVVVLRSVEPVVKAAYAADQFRPEHRKVTGVHLTA